MCKSVKNLWLDEGFAHTLSFISTTEKEFEMKRWVSIFAIAVLAATMNMSNVNAADYPPSIQAPTTGEPILAPVEPSKPGLKVVVPVATAEVIPLVTKAPVAFTPRLLPPTATISANAVARTPIQVANSIVIGGVSTSRVNQTPIAAVSAKRKNEIQLAEDVPTRIQIGGLTPRAVATVSLITSKGKTIQLGRITVNSKGDITLPPLTIEKDEVSATVRIVVGRTTTNVVIRTA